MQDFFGNSSVAAFFGAFCAFLLVAATDLRRKYRTRKLLRSLVADSQEHARKKRDAVVANIELIQKHGKITDSPFMRFPTGVIKEHEVQVLDLLDSAQKQGLDALLYWMNSIDELLNEATRRATSIKDQIAQGVPESTRTQEISRYIETLGEVETNLGYLVELTGYYVDGQPNRILAFFHPMERP